MATTTAEVPGPTRYIVSNTTRRFPVSTFPGPAATDPLPPTEPTANRHSHAFRLRCLAITALCLGLSFSCQPGDVPSFEADGEVSSETITPTLVGTVFLDASLIESKFVGLLKGSLQTKTKQTLKLTVNTVGILEDQDPDATIVWCHEMVHADGTTTTEPLCAIDGIACTPSEWQSGAAVVSTATVLLSYLKGKELVKEDHAIIAVLTSQAQASANAQVVCKQPSILLEPVRVQFSITSDVQGGMPTILLPTGKGCVTREEPIFASIPGVTLGNSASYAVTWKVNGTATASTQKGCVAGGNYSLCSGANINNALSVCSLSPTQYTKGDVVQVCVRICEVDDIEIDDDERCSEPKTVCDAWPVCTNPKAELVPQTVDGILTCSTTCTDADDTTLYSHLTFGPQTVEEPNWAEILQEGPFYYTANDGAVEVAISTKLSEQTHFAPTKGGSVCCRLRPYGSQSNQFPDGGLPYPYTDGVLDKTGDPPCVEVKNAPPTVDNVFVTPTSGTVGTVFTCSGAVSDPDVGDLAKLTREFVWYNPAQPVDQWTSTGALEKFPPVGPAPYWLKESTQLCCYVTVSDPSGAATVGDSDGACANLLNSPPVITSSDPQTTPTPTAQWTTNVWNADAKPGSDVCFDTSVLDPPGSGATQVYPWHELECSHGFTVIDGDGTVPIKTVQWYQHLTGDNYEHLADQNTLVPALTKPTGWDFNKAVSPLKLACRIRWCDATYPTSCVESAMSKNVLVSPIPAKAKSTCDDKQMCTTDHCDENLECQFTATPGSCDDANACTDGDYCSAGECISGDSVECADGNPCTEDYCDPAVGCVNKAGTKICDDGDACTQTDTCDSRGLCIGVPVICDDKNQCTKDSCDKFLGCVFAPLLGNPCDDNDVCTVNDECDDGVCKGFTLNCSDNNTCTKDSCDPIKGCLYQNESNGTPCDDNKPCTSADGKPNCNGLCDGCSAGACYGKPVVCDDNNPCTNDFCDEQAGCTHLPNTAFCNDNNPCTLADQCNEKVCVGTSLFCDDKNSCTTDSCSPVSGCVFVPNILPCNDGNSCTESDICGNGQCKGTLVNCAAILGGVQPCENALCDSTSGCYLQNKAEGSGCDDGDACTTGDVCTAGQCGGKLLVCTNLNLCSVAVSCDPIAGCVYAPPPGGGCDDGNPCTTGDKCSAGTCLGGTPTVCNDNNPCTNDTCDSKSGCLFTNNFVSCDDGNACTAPDSCSGGKCVAGPQKLCNDNNTCTSDTCDPVKGCIYTNLVATPCTDSNACTDNDTCNGGLCKGTSISCNDSNACTNDSCVSSSGCVFSPITGASCDDGNPCTITDKCSAAGVCGGSPNPCDDGNICTTATCDPVNGCKQNNTTAGANCDDGNPCTTNDKCAQGLCNGTPVADTTKCSDGNAATKGDQCLNGKCVGTLDQLP